MLLLIFLTKGKRHKYKESINFTQKNKSSKDIT